MGTPPWWTDTESTTCAAPHYSFYSGIHQDVELCMNTFKCIKIFTSMCNPKPYYTGKQCAEFFISIMYVLIFPVHYHCERSPVFLINRDNFALWGYVLRTAGSFKPNFIQLTFIDVINDSVFLNKIYTLPMNDYKNAIRNHQPVACSAPLWESYVITSCNIQKLMI